MRLNKPKRKTHTSKVQIEVYPDERNPGKMGEKPEGGNAVY